MAVGAAAPSVPVVFKEAPDALRLTPAVAGREMALGAAVEALAVARALPSALMGGSDALEAVGGAVEVGALRGVKLDMLGRACRAETGPGRESQVLRAHLVWIVGMGG